MYKVKIDITLKKSILDPQGKTVCAALQSLDFGSVESVRVGKFCEIQIDALSEKEAEAQVHEMCDKLLVNPVIEEYLFTIEKC